jgi:acyl-CoA synthetase (AMP-forming)/AMP-acid ligase II/serine acetyltransferase
MKNNPPLVIVGIVEKQSVAYVQSVFTALSAGEVVVPLRAKDDTQRIDMVGVSAIKTIDSVDGQWLHPVLSVPDSKLAAYVSFTSGTEGLPKAVYLSGFALNNTIERLQSVMQMDSSVSEYIGVPVYHSFGFARCRHLASVGGACYIPNNGFDPREFASLLLQGKINALSLVPSLLRLLIQNTSLLGDERQNLLWLEIGSQPMAADEKKGIKVLFPQATIVQHYGLTEASRTTLLHIDDVDDALLSSVGRCYGQTAININTEGRICIRGEHLACDVIKDGQSIGVLNDLGWFETSDLGRIDNGYLYFLGRADNMVNCGGQKLSTERFEIAVNKALPSNIRSIVELAISRIDSPYYGEGFLLSYCMLGNESKASPDYRVSIRALAESSLAELGIVAKKALTVQQVSQLPKTATGKIQHRELVKYYLGNIEKNSSPNNSGDSKALLIGEIAHIIGMPPSAIDMRNSISDVGVDSLQTVQLSIKIESHLGKLPAAWRNMPIVELIELPVTSDAVSVSISEPCPNGSKKAPPLWDGSTNRNPGDISFFALLKEDYLTHDSEFFSQGLFALFVNRFGNWRMSIRTKLLRFPMTLLYRVLRKMAQMLCGIKLDYTVQVGRRVKLEHFGSMILGARHIGDDTIIRQNTTFGIRDISDLSAKPIIEQGVNIGAGAVIVGDITVGRHSVIGPNCVVTENIPAFSVVSVSKPIVEVLSPSDKPPIRKK